MRIFVVPMASVLYKLNLFRAEFQRTGLYHGHSYPQMVITFVLDLYCHYKLSMYLNQSSASPVDKKDPNSLFIASTACAAIHQEDVALLV